MPKAPSKKQASSRKDPLTSTSGNRAKQPPKAANATQKQPNPARTSTDPKDWNYLVVVAMLPTEPMVNRVLSLPPTLKFSRFHAVIQTAFGWTNSHMYKFDIEWLEDGAWGLPLMTLSTHPELGIEEANDQNEADWTLADVYEKPEWKDKVRITYEYDMGDSWEHDICLLGRQQPSSWQQMGVLADMKAICLAGSGHPVAEDCGGFGGWNDLKELFEKPKSKDEDGRKQWYKTVCSNGDKKGLNPHQWDMIQVNTDLSDIGL